MIQSVELNKWLFGRERQTEGEGRTVQVGGGEVGGLWGICMVTGNT